MRAALLLSLPYWLLSTDYWLLHDADGRARGEGVEEFFNLGVLQRDAAERPVARGAAAVDEDFAAERGVPGRAAPGRQSLRDALVLRARDEPVAQAPLGVLRVRVGQAEREI